VRRFIAPTPLIAWPLLRERTGAKVHVKHENHTAVGAFKVRGGIVYVDWLRRTQPHVRGIVTATRGNHGQSIAFAASRAGLAAVVVVPHGNSIEKNEAMRALGAEMVVAGHDYQAAREHAALLAAERGYDFLGPFNEQLVRGVASYALELFSSGVAFDTVYVPIGMGSGICGLIAARDALGLSTEIVGVVSDAAPAYALSFERGAPVATASADTFVDGVACRSPDAAAVASIVAGAARIVRASDAAVAEAMRAYFHDTHNVAEPAGAIALAALLHERETMRGKTVALILSGGNVDAGVYADVLSGKR
jgi:threonine dehydratase